jgi:hypothetical protein
VPALLLVVAWHTRYFPAAFIKISEVSEREFPVPNVEMSKIPIAELEAIPH